MSASWQVGVDIGGTFTDIVAVDAAGGALREAKVKSVAGAPEASLDAALAAVGLDWDAVDDLMHGTTLATNAIVQDRLAPVALIATEGFGDVLAIGRQNRRELYRLDVPPKLPPLVPEALRLEVRERVDGDGGVRIALGDDEAARVTGALAALGVDAVAIALLNAYANPVHEKALAARLDGAVRHVALSHQVNPEAREFERTSATVLNAALMPLTGEYLDKLLDRAGNRTRLHLFHSAGGMASPEAMRDRPLALALSGPAAGVAAAGRAARELAIDHAISFDMGGTTTDVCLIVGGAAQISSNRMLAGRPMRQPMVAVESIGAGGGSIARVEGSAIRVGPASAGADPGPASYGQGGADATVSDANLLLGYLVDDRVLGGTVRLDRALAERAVGAIATAFGVGVDEAALGIFRVANANMARALRRVTVEQGVDARRCVLVAFGGAGPMHAIALARECGIERVVVPRSSSVFSALGCLSADLSYAQQQTVHMASGGWDAARLADLRDPLVERLTAPLLAAGHDAGALTVSDVAMVRYAGQSYAVEVPYAAPAEPERLGADFRAAHRVLYGFDTEEAWELEAIRVTVAAPPRQSLEAVPEPSGGTATAHASAPCLFEDAGWLETPRYDRAALGVEQRISGPAIIEDEWSTVVVEPRATAWSDALGHLHIDVAGAS